MDHRVGQGESVCRLRRSDQQKDVREYADAGRRKAGQHDEPPIDLCIVGAFMPPVMGDKEFLEVVRFGHALDEQIIKKLPVFLDRVDQNPISPPAEQVKAKG